MLAIFLDLETTGLDPLHHGVIDIAFEVVNINSLEVLSTYNRIVKQPLDVWEKHDPVSLGINGFTWDLVAQGTDPAEIGKEIIKLFQDLSVARGSAVFICQNPAFDRSFFTQLIDVYTQERLNWPYHWLDLASMYWTVLYQSGQKVGLPFPSKLNLSKNEIAKAYMLPAEQTPHRAINGVKHLMLCYQAILGVKFINKSGNL